MALTTAPSSASLYLFLSASLRLSVCLCVSVPSARVVYLAQRSVTSFFSRENLPPFCSWATSQDVKMNLTDTHWTMSINSENLCATEKYDTRYEMLF